MPAKAQVALPPGKVGLNTIYAMPDPVDQVFALTRLLEFLIASVEPRSLAWGTLMDRLERIGARLPSSSSVVVAVRVRNRLEHPEICMEEPVGVLRARWAACDLFHGVTELLEHAPQGLRNAVDPSGDASTRLADLESIPLRSLASIPARDGFHSLIPIPRPSRSRWNNFWMSLESRDKYRPEDEWIGQALWYIFISTICVFVGLKVFDIYDLQREFGLSSVEGFACISIVAALVSGTVVLPTWLFTRPPAKRPAAKSLPPAPSLPSVPSPPPSEERAGTAQASFPERSRCLPLGLRDLPALDRLTDPADRILDLGRLVSFLLPLAEAGQIFGKDADEFSYESWAADDVKGAVARLAGREHMLRAPGKVRWALHVRNDLEHSATGKPEELRPEALAEAATALRQAVDDLLCEAPTNVARAVRGDAAAVPLVHTPTEDEEAWD